VSAYIFIELNRKDRKEREEDPFIRDTQKVQWMSLRSWRSWRFKCALNAPIALPREKGIGAFVGGV